MAPLCSFVNTCGSARTIFCVVSLSPSSPVLCCVLKLSATAPNTSRLLPVTLPSGSLTAFISCGLPPPVLGCTAGTCTALLFACTFHAPLPPFCRCVGVGSNEATVSRGCGGCGGQGGGGRGGGGWFRRSPRHWTSCKIPLRLWPPVWGGGSDRSSLSFLALLSPPPLSAQVEGALLGIEESVQATPTPLKGKEASTEQSMEGPEAKVQPSVATPIKEDTRPKVLIRGEWRKVLDGYLRDASSQLERDQLFINDLAKQLVAELRAACHNTGLGAKPKSNDTKADLIYKRAFCNYLLQMHVL